jgi:quercetin 2,3-dioxygenase
MTATSLRKDGEAALSRAVKSREITSVVRGIATSDGAGVKLTRIIGQPALESLDPFLMLDAFNSDDPGAYIAGFPPHPHRGFETVTYMLAGAMRHRDNKGNVGFLGPGAMQWMTAGAGIVHSEMPEQKDGLMRGFQLWLNLPARDKMTPANYRDVPAEEIPAVELAKGVSAKILAGEVEGHKGAVGTRATEPILLDIVAEAGAHLALELTPGHNAFVYVYEGEAALGPVAKAKTITKEQLGVLSDGDRLEVAAGPQGARLLVGAAKPLNEPVAKYGPFVMNTEAEIKQAIDDFHAGRF